MIITIKGAMTLVAYAAWSDSAIRNDTVLEAMEKAKFTDISVSGRFINRMYSERPKLWQI